VNKSIQNLATTIVVGFVIVAVTLGYWQVVRASDLTSDFRLNRYRLLEQEKRIARGRILDRSGGELAWTEMKDGVGTRVYSQPYLSHVTGFHSLMFGNTNVEQSFDAYLRGDVGVDPISALVSGALGQPPKGADVVLTIDSEIQRAAEEALGPAKGAVVAVEPRTGSVLAMVSHPYFDPNRLEKDWDKLKEDPGDPLLNRATQGLYVPGSTFKTITLAAALEEGVASPDEVFEFDMSTDNEGKPYHVEMVGGFPVVCANHGMTSPGKAVMTLSDVYAASCNVAFARLGLRLGPDRLAEYAKRFGFESTPPIEIPSEASHIASSPTFLQDRVAVASTAFGQGELLATPLQLALVAAAIANEGTVPTPHIVQEVRAARGLIFVSQPKPWKQAVSPETARIVKDMMVAGVRQGWASPASIEGVDVAGKTGTAEVRADETPHAWFIGFAPANDPKIAVAVIKENAGAGGTQAGPIAKKVMEAALR